MALRLALKDLIRATLPQGGGWMGCIGLSPDGDAYHLLAPLDLDQAQILSAAGGQALGGGLAEHGLGLRPGWRYLPCPTYQPPAPSPQGRPAQGDFAEARRRRALRTAAEITAWARRRGWWVEIE